MRVTNYNPKEVTCALGNHIVSGFADDSFIAVEPAGDGTSYVCGADGEIARSIDPSRIYTVKLTLQQQSRTNAFLDKKYRQDQKDGKGTFSVAVNDILGNEKFVGAVGWVTKTAAWNRGKQQQNREWELVVAEGEIK